MPPLRIASSALLTFAIGLASAQMSAAATIGVVAPKSGPYVALGEQVFQGARAAARDNGDTLVEIDESCDEAGGTAAAKALIEAQASMAIGFLCVETLGPAMPSLAERSIPAITIAVRSRILMEDALRNGWPVFRMAPADGAEAEKIAAEIIQLWKAEPIALIDDGTIYGRELVSAVRQKLQTTGISPVFTDTLRPGQEQQIALIRRLQKAGATHVLVGADRNDVAILARDAAAESIPLTLMGGDVMRAADRPVELADGVLAVALPDYRHLTSAAKAVSDFNGAGEIVEGYVLPAYAAMQIAGQVARTSLGSSADLSGALSSTAFPTAIGQIKFNAERELADNPYQLLEWNGLDFVRKNQVAETE